MPQGETVKGPVQVNNADQPHRPRSRPRSRCSTSRARGVIQGSLQLIPVGNSIVYVRPVLRAGPPATGSFPQFQFVVGVHQDGAGAVCDQTVNGALDQIFLGAPPPPSCGALGGGTTTDGNGNGTPTTTTLPGSTTTTSPAASGSVQQLLDQAADAFNQAQTALAQRDLASYQKFVDQGQRLLEQARQQLAAQR